MTENAKIESQIQRLYETIPGLCPAIVSMELLKTLYLAIKSDVEREARNKMLVRNRDN